MEIEDIKIEVKKKHRKKITGLKKGGDHGTGGSGAPPATYMDEPSANQ